MNKFEERIELELGLINQNNFISIKQLSKAIGVSEMTIRRDITHLVELNKIKNVYGGVIPIKNTNTMSYTLQNEKDKNIDNKSKIAKYAYSLIEPNDTLFFDTGTTVQTLAEQLNDNFSYTIITSSFNSLVVLTQLTNSTIITPGGIFSQKPKVFYDLNSVNSIKRYKANKCFIGATGYDIDLGITCSYLEDAPIKQAMISCSKEKILLLDSSKFGVSGTCQFATLDQFDMVITDSGIPEEYAKKINEASVKLILTQ